METPGYVHSFQSLGAVDGPGLRFVVFLQGCPLRCCYCHNPDTWQAGQGQRLLPSQVAARALRYRCYLRHGGVTLTGGEPLWQPRFAAELFALLQAQGLHTALDTSGVGDLEAAAAVLRHTDLALVDVKFLTEEDYLRHTGGRLCQVRAFLDLCLQQNVPIWARHVVVPGLTDGQDHLRRLLAFLAPYSNLQKIELLPFRKLCLEKYDALGIPFPLREVPEMDQAGVDALRLLLPPSLR